MNNKFKFRVWDGKKIHYVNMDDTGDTFRIFNCGKDFYLDLTVSPENPVIILIVGYDRCTGLKDANSKLIYENDILQNEDGNIDIIELGRFNCSCCEGVYGYTFRNNKLDIRRLQENPPVIINKVIGNIHENPELLCQSSPK